MVKNSTQIGQLFPSMVSPDALDMTVLNALALAQ